MENNQMALLNWRNELCRNCYEKPYIDLVTGLCQECFDKEIKQKMFGISPKCKGRSEE